MDYSTSLSSWLPLPLLCFVAVGAGIKATLILHRKALNFFKLVSAYIPGVTFKSIKHWSTCINQKSIKLLSNLKQSYFTSQYHAFFDHVYIIMTTNSLLFMIQ